MRVRNSEKGVAVVEFALLSLLLIIFVFGIIEFGFLWLQSHYISNAAREGARVASKIADVDSDGVTLNNSGEVQTAVQNAIKQYLQGAVVYGAKVNQCCAEGNLIYVETPGLETISGAPAVRINLTVQTAEIWEPVLWNLMNLVPGSNFGDIRQISETALFPVIINN